MSAIYEVPTLAFNIRELNIPILKSERLQSPGHTRKGGTLCNLEDSRLAVLYIVNRLNVKLLASV